MNNLFLKLVILISMFEFSNIIYGQNNFLSSRIESSLPNNAKLKKIEYKSFGYSISGYVCDNKFVEGKEIAIYSSIYGSPFLIIKGIYFCKDGISYLESIFEAETTIKMIFKISNTVYQNNLSANKKISSDLKIEISDIISVNGVLKLSGGRINIVRTPSDDFKLTISYNDKTLEHNLEKKFLEQIIIDANRAYTENWLNIIRGLSSFFTDTETYKNEILNSKNIKLTFLNGDIFEGKITTKLQDYDFIPNNGKYTFATGEIYKGSIARIFWEEFEEKIPRKGKMSFTDGSEEDGDWLIKYNVTENDLSTAKTLTEKHTLAQKLFNEQQRKLDDEKKKLNQKEEQNRIAEYNLRNSLIKKYGEHIGGLLIKKEVEVGMTMAMITEVFPKDYFIVKKSVVKGIVIEEWLFSKEKMFKNFINKSNDPNVNVLAMLIIDNPELVGGKEFPIERLVFVDNILKDIYYTPN